MHGELYDTESRCHLLEKQLDYMRQMVKTAETDHSDTTKRVGDIEQQRYSASTRELQSQIDKISDLERDHLRMTATQTLAQVYNYMGIAPKTQSAQGEGSLLTAGNYFESGKSECNNSGYKLTGLTWWP